MRAIACGLAALVLVGGVSSSSPSQQNPARNVPPLPTVTFTLNFPHSDPEEYSIMVDNSGHGRYECAGSVTPGADPETYRTEFEVSGESREKIFEWAKQARYFSGNIDSGNRKLAFTGTKTLDYQDGQHDNSARYDYSNVAAVRQLTSLFQGMAATLEYGRRLTYYHHYQKLALDDELKQMETQAKNNELSELQIVAPILQEIVDDNSVLNIVRVRARELMQIGNNSAAAGGHNAR
jgi:hypothetical protein